MTSFARCWLLHLFSRWPDHLQDEIESTQNLSKPWLFMLGSTHEVGYLGISYWGDDGIRRQMNLPRTLYPLGRAGIEIPFPNLGSLTTQPPFHTHSNLDQSPCQPICPCLEEIRILDELCWPLQKQIHPWRVDTRPIESDWKLSRINDDVAWLVGQHKNKRLHTESKNLGTSPSDTRLRR